MPSPSSQIFQWIVFTQKSTWRKRIPIQEKRCQTLHYLVSYTLQYAKVSQRVGNTPPHRWSFCVESWVLLVQNIVLLLIKKECKTVFSYLHLVPYSWHCTHTASLNNTDIISCSVINIHIISKQRNQSSIAIFMKNILNNNI